MAKSISLYFPTEHVYQICDPLPTQDIIAGISETCDLDLRRFFHGDQVRTISRRHFKLTFIDGEGCLLFDLHSRNGTWLNGQPLEPRNPQFLKDGDVLMLAGNEAFVIEVAAGDVARTERYVPASQPLVERASSEQRRDGLFYLSDEGEYVLDGRVIPHEALTPLETRFLDYLYQRSGRICTYEELITYVWEYPPPHRDVQNNTVAKAVSNIRKKLDRVSDGAGLRHVHTVHGRGVKLIPVEARCNGSDPKADS